MDDAGERQPVTSTRDRLAAAKLPERTVELCLRGDLQAEWEDLHRRLEVAQAAQSRDKRLNSSAGEVQEIGQQIAGVQEQMRADTIVVRMRALGRRAWGDLVKAHPARKDNTDDERAGFNTDTFANPAIRASVYAPDDLDDATWDELLNDRITEFQHTELINAVFALNVRPISIPNSFAASQILRGSSPE